MLFIATLLGTTVLGAILFAPIMEEQEEELGEGNPVLPPNDFSSQAPGDAFAPMVTEADLMDAIPEVGLAQLVPREALEDADGDGNAFGLGNGLLNGKGNAINDIEGTQDGDLILGGSAFLYADGGLGDDTMVAGLDSAFFDGGDGHDILFGQAGHDQLQGGSGDDSLWGGTGNDTLSGGNGANMIVGGDGDDFLSGGGDASLLSGGAGDDHLQGGGNDTLHGGIGSDTIRAFTGTSEDTTRILATVLQNSEGNVRDMDTGSDIVSTSNVNTSILAGSGDYITVGSGADTIVVGDWVTGEEVRVANFDGQNARLLVVYNDAIGAMPEIRLEVHLEREGVTMILVNGKQVAAVHTLGEALSLKHLLVVPFSQFRLDDH